MHDFVTVAKEVVRLEAEELLAASERLDTTMTQAVEMIYQNRGKLIVMGVGKSGLVGGKIAATLASTGTRSFFLHPTEAMHGDLGMIGREDMVLAISYSGESEELIALLPHIKRFGIPLIAMAGNANSTLALQSDLFISIAVTQEACPLNVAPTASTTLTMALGDALAVCLMHKRGFKHEDFASFHPGGTLGKRLFVKAIDMMRTRNLPIVSHETPLKEAISVMTEGRLGNVLIIDQAQKLVAILSDGDLRRALMRVDFDLSHPALDYATHHPRVCSDLSILASDALRFVEEHKIQILVMTGEERRVKGVLHIHDLVEAGNPVVHLINAHKLQAIDAARAMLVDVMEVASDSQYGEALLEKLDQIDEYLCYTRNLEELDTIQGRQSTRGKGYLYHLIKKQRNQS